MTNKFEYILSGTNHTDIHRGPPTPEIIAELDAIFAKVEQNTNHRFGILYNALIEASFGEKFQKFKSPSSVHADSGGLQLMTLGIAVTPEVKKQVYTNQGLYSDLGMCFDEVPVRLAGSTSSRTSAANRIFDLEHFERAAKETGKNLLEQINEFASKNSKCKPIMIVHGNCIDTYRRWTELVLAEIPQDLHIYIGGVAVGATAMGVGNLEDIERAFLVTQLPIELKHLHVLGVGSLSRILPYVIFANSSLYGNISISYDSTTHSSGIHLGNYFHGGVTKKFTRTWGSTYDIMFDEIGKLVDHGIDKKDFHKILNQGYVSYTKEGLSARNYNVAKLAAIVSAIIQFCQCVDSLVSSRESISAFIGNKTSLKPLEGLFDVKDLASYNRWKESFGKYVQSDRIPKEKSTSLEEFFQ